MGEDIVLLSFLFQKCILEDCDFYTHMSLRLCLGHGKRPSQCPSVREREWVTTRSS